MLVFVINICSVVEKPTQKPFPEKGKFLLKGNVNAHEHMINDRPSQSEAKGECITVLVSYFWISFWLQQL